MTCIRQACTISRREEDESEPYKNKYQAADLLDKVLGERTLGFEQPAPNKDSSTVEEPVVQTLTNPCPLVSDSFVAVGSSGCSDTSGPSVLELAAAAARIRGGLILLETELLTDGESRIEAGLNHLEKCPEAYLAWLLESYNALGALYRCARTLSLGIHTSSCYSCLKQTKEGEAEGIWTSTAPGTDGNPPRSNNTNNSDGNEQTRGKTQAPATTGQLATRQSIR